MYSQNAQKKCFFFAIAGHNTHLSFNVCIRVSHAWLNCTSVYTTLQIFIRFDKSGRQKRITFVCSRTRNFELFLYSTEKFQSINRSSTKNKNNVIRRYDLTREHNLCYTSKGRCVVVMTCFSIASLSRSVSPFGRFQILCTYLELERWSASCGVTKEVRSSLKVGTSSCVFLFYNGRY